jgi:hypothetical protein
MAVAAPAWSWRFGLLVGISVAAVLWALLAPPLRQPLAYHDFADQRVMLGVPHALNVLSNVGFLLAGGWGLAAVRRASLPAWERGAGYLFAAGVILTGLGSAWYHAGPSNASLVWDRLPLSTLFPTVLAVTVGDRIGSAVGRALLVPLTLAALASVLWWQQTDDLRPYALAQFLPLVLVPLMLALFPGGRPTAPLIWAVVLYALGKVVELGDRAILGLGGLISGHTVKHLLVAAAAALVVRWLVAPPAQR